MRESSTNVILDSVKSQGPQTFSELLARTGLSRSTLSAGLKELVKQAKLEYFHVAEVKEKRVLPLALIPNEFIEELARDYKDWRWRRSGKRRRGRWIPLTAEASNGNQVRSDRLEALSYEKYFGRIIRRRVYWLPMRYKITRRGTTDIWQIECRIG